MTECAKHDFILELFSLLFVFYSKLIKTIFVSKISYMELDNMTEQNQGIKECLNELKVARKIQKMQTIFIFPNKVPSSWFQNVFLWLFELLCLS